MTADDNITSSVLLECNIYISVHSILVNIEGTVEH